jgi:uncharacterized protein YodC (DUF2158 family)
MTEPDEPLQPGDVVRLRSGGPDMTIMSIGVDHVARCLWFDDHDELRSAELAVEGLQLAD